MKKKVSVIVPVYNVEDYLEDCIRSINKQTYKNFEVILVNDGSTDSSSRIASKACEEDNRFKLINQNNLGASVARNNGIRLASGDYITFVDSDDFLIPEAIEKLVSLIEDYKADISVIGSAKLHMNGKYSVKANKMLQGVTIKQGVECAESLLEDSHFYTHAVWGKLYKRSIINHVESPVGLTAEDTYVSLVCALKCNTIVMDYDAPMYVYRMRPNSISTSPMNRARFDFFEVYILCYKELERYPRLQKKCARRICRSFVSLIGQTYSLDLKERKQYNEKVAFLRSSVTQYFDKEALSKSEIIAYYLGMYAPSVLGGLFRKRNNRNGIIEEPTDDSKVIDEIEQYIVNTR